MYLSRSREPQVVRTPRVRITSLTATGTPASGPGSWPAAILRSTSRAADKARSGEKVRYALVLGFSAWANASALRANSSALNSFARRPARMESTVKVERDPLDMVTVRLLWEL